MPIKDGIPDRWLNEFKVNFKRATGQEAMPDEAMTGTIIAGLVDIAHSLQRLEKKRGAKAVKTRWTPKK